MRTGGCTMGRIHAGFAAPVGTACTGAPPLPCVVPFHPKGRRAIGNEPRSEMAGRRFLAGFPWRVYLAKCCYGTLCCRLFGERASGAGVVRWAQGLSLQIVCPAWPTMRQSVALSCRVITAEGGDRGPLSCVKASLCELSTCSNARWRVMFFRCLQWVLRVVSPDDVAGEAMLSPSATFWWSGVPARVLDLDRHWLRR